MLSYTKIKTSMMQKRAIKHFQPQFVLVILFLIINGVLLRSVNYPTANNLEECPASCTCYLDKAECNFPLQTNNGKVARIPKNTKYLLIKVTGEFWDANHSLQDLTDLRSLSVKGLIPSLPVLPYLESLTYVDLSQNALTYFPSNSLQNNPQIIHLNLSRNAITSVTQDSLKNLRVLATLDLSFNPSIRELPSDFFSSTAHLEWLSLSNANISLFSNSWSQHLRSLRYLNLNHNKIYSLRSINLRSLVTLDISHNPLRALPPLHNFPNLVNVSASHTFVSNFKESEFKTCKLQTLDLSFSKITLLHEGVLSNCKDLITLNLSFNHALWRLFHGSLGGLESLEVLRLDHCSNLVELEHGIFNGLNRLRELNLQYTEIKVLPRSLSSLENLTSLNLQGTSIFCDCHAFWFSDILPILNRISTKEDTYFTIPCTDGVRRTPTQVANHVSNLNCSTVKSETVSNTWIRTRWGDNATLECKVVGNPKPEIIWLTSKKGIYVYNEEVSSSSWLPNQISETLRNANHEPDAKFSVLPSGGLLIRNVNRGDIGRYKCFAFNAVSNSSVVTFLGLDETRFREFVIESIIFGGMAALAFLLITLLVQFIKYLMMRFGWICCCGEKRLARKSRQIRQLIESIESYKSTQLERLRDNYYSQVASIKDGCFQQMERVRDSYSNQSKNLRDLCDYSSQQITGARDQYLDQVNKIREYSVQQTNRVRENYIFQRHRIRKFSNHQVLRLRETYKYQQKTLNKLMENLPDLYIQNCRSGSCQRTDSVMFDEIEDLNIYYKVNVLLDNQSLGSDYYYTPNSTLNRKGKLKKKHSRNVSTTSSATENHAWLTPSGSITSENEASNGFFIGPTFPPGGRVQDIKKGKHRRCFSASGAAMLVQLFQPKSTLIEEVADHHQREEPAEQNNDEISPEEDNKSSEPLLFKSDKCESSAKQDLSNLTGETSYANTSQNVIAIESDKTDADDIRQETSI